MTVSNSSKAKQRRSERSRISKHERRLIASQHSGDERGLAKLEQRHRVAEPNLDPLKDLPQEDRSQQPEQKRTVRIVPDAPPLHPNIIVDECEPKEIIDKLKDAGADVKVMSLARRAFQDV